LQDKLDFGDISLPPDEIRQLIYLKNLLEAGIGAKTTLSEDNRRLSVRVPCQKEISVRINDATIKSIMYNISTGGIFIACDIVPPLGESLAIELEGFKGEQITRTGFVKWIAEKGSSIGPFELPPGIGAQLHPLSKEEEEPFRNLFYNLLEQNIIDRT